MVVNPDVISNEVREIIIENKIYETWMKNSSEGLIICKDKDLTILYINKQCVEMLIIDEQNVPDTLLKVFNEEEIRLLSNGKGYISKSFRGTLEINCIKINNYLLIIINDLTHIATVEDKVNEIKQLNKELQTVYEQYADDTIFITNGKGIVEFAGTAISANCGVNPGYLIGKSVYDLEEAKFFYPSITRIVLESKQTEVTIQNTKIGKTLVSVGTPILDKKGDISKIISITRDFSRQIKIGTLLSVHKHRQDESDFNGRSKDIITCNDKMLNILNLAKLVAMVNSTVLIYGETGTGKEVVARYIHNSGPRSSQPFIKVNCGAISPNLVESELFGYEPGSFTGASREGKIGLVEAANGGTLFLDEIGELPLDQQVKILQVIQERTMTRVGGTKSIKLDIRIIAATNKILENLVNSGEFREDLFYRLNVVPIDLPPLRERKEDIPLLIRHFLRIFNNNNDGNKEFTKEAFSAMLKYHWPGNVRELVNTVERLTITAKDTFIEVEDLPRKIQGKYEESNVPIQISKIIRLDEANEYIEKVMIQMAVTRYGTGKKAAEMLGVDQSTISRKMRRYNIEIKKD